MANLSAAAKKGRIETLRELVSEANEVSFLGNPVKAMPLESLAERLDVSPQALDLQLTKHSVPTFLAAGQNRTRLVPLAAYIDSLTAETVGSGEGLMDESSPKSDPIAEAILLAMSNSKFDGEQTVRMVESLTKYGIALATMQPPSDSEV